MKPGVHVVGSDHKRRGKFILWAKNKLRHEFHNLVNKNHTFSKIENSESNNDLNMFLNNSRRESVEEEKIDIIPVRLSSELKQGNSSRRMKHPRVLLPEKNKLKIKAFSVESKLRNFHKQAKRSISPARSILNSGKYSERGNHIALCLEDDGLEYNFSFRNSFRDCSSANANTNKIQDTNERDTLHLYKIN